MNAATSPRPWAPLFVMVGSLAAMTGTAALFVTGVHEWRYLIAAGCLVQSAGCVLHRRHRRGGAR